MAKKSKNKKVINVKPIENHDNIQLNIKKELEKEKEVKVKDVFQNYPTKKKSSY